MSLWRWLFPRRSLEGLASPTRCRLPGVIAEGAMIESPVTGRRAAVIGWFFSRRFSQVRSSRGAGQVVDRDGFALISGGLLAPPWVLVDVDGQLVRVTTEALRASIASSDFDGEILDELPEFARHVRVDPRSPHLRYGERWLTTGDTVILTAEVRPVVEAKLSPYRESQRTSIPHADFEALGVATLVDTIGTDLRVRR